MVDRAQIEAALRERECETFRWIDPEAIVVAHWVRMKCAYGCDGYGRNASCPPNTPAVDDCRRFFRDYREAVMIRFEKAVAQPADRRPWARQMNQRLLKLERDVFLKGYPKAFALYMDNCRVCAECEAKLEDCRSPESIRPAPEAMAVDVFSTARAAGFPIEVLTDYSQAMNRYGFLLVE